MLRICAALAFIVLTRRRSTGAPAPLQVRRGAGHGGCAGGGQEGQPDPWTRDGHVPGDDRRQEAPGRLVRIHRRGDRSSRSRRRSRPPATPQSCRQVHGGKHLRPGGRPGQLPTGQRAVGHLRRPRIPEAGDPGRLRRHDQLPVTRCAARPDAGPEGPRGRDPEAYRVVAVEAEAGGSSSASPTRSTWPRATRTHWRETSSATARRTT